MEKSFRPIKVDGKVMSTEQRFQQYLLWHPREAQKLRKKQQEREKNIKEELERKFWRKWVKDKRRQEMLDLRAQDLTLQQIANKYGISRERVRQILL